MLVAVRLLLPNRPGMLGAVATVLGNEGANILTLDVVERSDGFAVDQLALEIAPGTQEDLRRRMEEVPGVVVEELRHIEAFQDVLAPLELAAALAENAGGKTLELLVRKLPAALSASWAAALAVGPGRPKLLAASGRHPSFEGIQTPWIPLEGPRRLGLGRWMPVRWRTGLAARLGLGIYEVAAAPLFGAYSAVLVGRRSGPRFRSLELDALGLLARIAAAISAGATLEAEEAAR